MDTPENKLFVQAIQTHEIYQGSLPHPDILKKLGEIDPSYPERIMKMTEDNNRAEIINKNRESISGILGQILSFALGCVGFGLSALFAFKGLETGAIAAAIGGIAPIIVAAIGNLRK
ncbi:MAG: hypothetical protein LBT14_04250 [Treponema sp.]|jgi:uncharacterized membrane protein|nr:hypothetical protein [Treponema sp.]